MQSKIELGAKIFQELTHLLPDKNYSLINQVDYFALLELSAKLSRSNDPEIRQILARNRATRREMYQELLPPSKFLALDKANWYKLVHLLCFHHQSPCFTLPPL